MSRTDFGDYEYADGERRNLSTLKTVLEIKRLRVAILQHRQPCTRCQHRRAEKVAGTRDDLEALCSVCPADYLLDKQIAAQRVRADAMQPRARR